MKSTVHRLEFEHTPSTTEVSEFNAWIFAEAQISETSLLGIIYEQ